MSYPSNMEEEMIRLAQEMSLLEEYPDLSFNRNNLKDTNDRLRVYEEIVDDIRVKEYDDIDAEPMTESEVRALFFGHDGDDFTNRPSSMSMRAEKPSSRRQSEKVMQGRMSS
ncbi:hypothetical protein EON64_21385, partial [archaeon]